MAQNRIVEIGLNEELLVPQVHPIYNVLDIKGWGDKNQPFYVLGSMRKQISKNVVSPQRSPDDVQGIRRVKYFYPVYGCCQFVKLNADEGNRTGHFRIDAPTI